MRPLGCKTQFSNFAVAIWQPSATAAVVLKSIREQYFPFWPPGAITVASMAVYGLMSHLNGGRFSPLTSTVALKWQNCNGDACNGLYEGSCNHGLRRFATETHNFLYSNQFSPIARAHITNKDALWFGNKNKFGGNRSH